MPTVLISGCSSGIGHALARAFHARGCTVVATARRIETLRELADRGIRIAELDVDNADSISTLVSGLAREGVEIDVLINNAGFGLMGPLAELPVAEIRRQFDTNVLGLLALTQAVVPAMRKRGRGCIVNIGSVSGILVTPFAGAYCASKAAVHAISDALRMELAPFGIRVLTVQPGAIRSHFGATASHGVSNRKAPDSAYAAVADAIAARANASQQHATRADVFANTLVDAVLSGKTFAALRIGSGSTLLPALARWLPPSWRDRLLSRRFQLDRLAAR